MTTLQELTWTETVDAKYEHYQWHAGPFVIDRIMSEAEPFRASRFDQTIGWTRTLNEAKRLCAALASREG